MGLERMRVQLERKRGELGMLGQRIERV